LSIAKLNTNHTGKYECKLNSSSGTRIQSISLTVISNKTKFCGVEGDLIITHLLTCILLYWYILTEECFLLF